MKDDPDDHSLSMSRRTFLTLSTAFVWPFHDRRATQFPLFVAMSKEQKNRKEQFLTQKRPTTASSIADAIVMKDDNVFLVTQPDGNVPLQGGHGYGLYYHDCRYLNGYEFQLAGNPIPALVGSAVHGFMGTFELSNPELTMPRGEKIKKEEILIRWDRIIDSNTLVLHDRLVFHHYGHTPADLSVSCTFSAGFEDLFAVKGMLLDTLGERPMPLWHEGVLGYVYEGKDHVYRSLAVQFSPTPHKTDGATAHFQVTLDPGETKPLHISLAIRESSNRQDVQPKPVKEPDLKKLESDLHKNAEAWLASVTEISSDSFLLQQIMNRSLRDLRVLRSTLDKETYFAAGVPWFVTLFGRDSLITALETLAYDPDISAQTLRLMATYQGTRVDEWRDEQPGKMLHELRVGEAARLGLIPQTPYYGSIDTTVLYLILIGRHAAWTGDLTLFHELRRHVERALDWMDTYGDRHGNAYLAYTSSASSQEKLVNQGWKDSGDAIVNDDGSMALPPIALVEVQGYAYWAKLEIADLYERVGEADRAARLRQEADRLKRRFNRDFWLEEKVCYALALQEGGKPAAVMSSNAGQALWSGIVQEEKAAPTVARLMAEDMFCGWGIRTLSSKERAYNPASYHLGSVWPHDNALIAAGMRQYGFDEAARRVFDGLVKTAMHLKAYQLPELFCGFHQEDYHIPVRYPVADHPQAWASGAMPYLLTTLLGLVPEGFAHRLRIVRPMLPDSINTIDVRRLRVGKATVDLRYERAADGHVAVRVLKRHGELDVVVEQGKGMEEGSG